MPGKKLAPEKRKELRSEVGEKLKAGVVAAEIVKTLSAKYSVSGQTIRRYLGEAGHSPGRRRKAAAARGTTNRGGRRAARALNGSARVFIIDGKQAQLVLKTGKKERLVANIAYQDEKRLLEVLQTAVEGVAAGSS